MIGTWFIPMVFYTTSIWCTCYCFGTYQTSICIDFFNSAIFILRTYAICNRNRLVLAVLLPLFAAKIGVDIVSS